MKKITLTFLMTAFIALASVAQTSKYTDDDYMKFKKETDEKIMANEKKIAELKEKKAQSKSEMKDEMYASRIAGLEERNKNLKTKVADYKTADHSNWESFKKEVNHDMKELGQALKDFTVDNTNTGSKK